MNKNPQYSQLVNNVLMGFIEQHNLDKKVLKPIRNNNIPSVMLTTSHYYIHNNEVVHGMSDDETVTLLRHSDITTNKKTLKIVYIYNTANMESM